MTDIASPPPLTIARVFELSSTRAQARIRRRYRSEARFKAYGLLALVVAAVFLVALISNIVMKGLPAFTQYSLLLDVAIPADLVEPEKQKDPVAMRSADYFPVTRDALMAAIPGIESRAGEKALTRVLSSGAGDHLSNKLAGDPALIGQTLKVPLLLSASADLYFKGVGTPIVARPGRGIATPSGTNGEITILTSSNDFAVELVAIKRALAERVRQIEAEVDTFQRTGSGSLMARAKQLAEEAAAYRARIDQPKVEEQLDANMSSVLVEINGGLVKVARLSDVGISGEVLLPLSSAADAGSGSWKIVNYVTAENNRKTTDQEIAFLERFRELGKVERRFNWAFFTTGDSREPELAGIRGALMGSALTLLITLVLCLPIGVMAAIYLEEFAQKNRLTDLIEVNINNLAAVPSIVFGLLGLAVFLNFFGLPRSAPLVGGLVLALLVLPTIIIAARAALKAVPPSIKEAALGVGASHQQAVFHHVLPLAMPGIMTGTIIGMAHALGETAPLLMIGMVAFIVDVPSSFTQAATVLPVQVYLWSDLPELAFQYKTAAAIMVLLLFLFCMNGMAIWLRRRFERRW
ncbi:MAG: phosphate ABC transporter permease PstA [Hyphomicrobiaceae bacterium]